MFALLVVMGTPFVWRVCRQYWAVRQIERVGGKIATRRGGPDWLRKYVGNRWMKPFDGFESVQASHSASIDRFEPYLRLFITRPRFIVGDSPVWPLLDEEKVGNESQIREILERYPALINACDDIGRSTLRIAAQEKPDLVPWLLEHGADVNAVDDVRSTPLHKASTAGVVQRLVAHGADVNARNKWELTPLEDVVLFHLDYEGLQESLGVDIRRLPRQMADVRVRVDALIAAGARHTLDTACAVGDVEAVRRLLSEPGQALTPDAMREAVRHGHAEIVQLLIDRGADPRAELLPRERRNVVCNLGGPVAMPTAWYGVRHAAVLKVLLRAGADPNPPQYSLLRDAADRECADSCRVLLEFGASVNAADHSGETALHRAVGRANVAIVKLLLAHGAKASIRIGDESILAATTIRGGERAADVPRHMQDIARLLIEHGHPVDLQAAIAADDLEQARALLAKTPRLANFTSGMGPMEYAIHLDRPQIVLLLIDVGARVYGKSTPLHRAVSWGREEVVRVMLEQHPDVDARDGDGITPLHVAVGQGAPGIVRLLIEAGANREISNTKQETPLIQARQCLKAYRRWPPDGSRRAQADAAMRRMQEIVKLLGG